MVYDDFFGQVAVQGLPYPAMSLVLDPTVFELPVAMVVPSAYPYPTFALGTNMGFEPN